MDCIGCGSCSYVCPAHIPLVQYFNYAKGEMAARDRAKQKQTETKRLAEQRTQRMEAIKRAKRAAMAKRKREAEEKTARDEAGLRAPIEQADSNRSKTTIEESAA